MSMMNPHLVYGQEPSPPPPVDPAWLSMAEQIIGVLMKGDDVPPAWDEEALSALAEARLWVERWRIRGTDCMLVLEVVNEPSVAGPGRAVKLSASWLERKGPGGRGGRMSYPPMYPDATRTIHTVRALIEHVVLN